MILTYPAEMTKTKQPMRARRKLLKASHAIRFTKELLSLAERSAKAGTWSWDIQTGEIAWSQGMFTLFGFNPARDVPSFEIWLPRVHPDDRARALNLIDESLKRRDYMFNQYRIVLPSGELRWIDAYGDLTLDAQGCATRMSGFCLDSTKRVVLEVENSALGEDLDRFRQLEEDLRKSEERLELALTGTGLALWDWDISLRKVFAGTHWLHMLGYDKGEFGDEEDDWMALIHPQDLERFKSKLSACLIGDNVIFECQHRLRHKGGHWVYVEAKGKISHRSKDGAPQRMVGTVRDISQSKRLNDEGIELLRKIEVLIADATTTMSAIPERDNPLERLSRRQRQTLAMIATGMTSGEIAKELKISTATAIGHRRELMKKLGLHKVADVTRFALRYKLIRR
jgi:PAS domain S-box-containing protein